MHCIECGSEISSELDRQTWNQERGCCSPECLRAWERYRVGEVCRALPLMDKIVAKRSLKDALRFLTELLSCRLTIDHVNGWRISADTVWQSPDWGWFGSREAGIFHTIDGFSFSNNENIGFRRAHLSVVGEDLVDTVLAMIADITNWRRACIRDCDHWVLAHAEEAELWAMTASAHSQLPMEALDELHEWIQVL